MTEPCRPETQNPGNYDVVIQGEIVAKPLPRIYLVKVERYYKGDGARYLLVEEESGHFARSSWANAPTGRQWVYGYEDGPAGLADGWCHYSAAPGEPSVQSLEPGTPPRGGIDLGLRLFWIDVGLVVLVAAVVARTIWLWRKGGPDDAEAEPVSDSSYEP